MKGLSLDRVDYCHMQLKQCGRTLRHPCVGELYEQIFREFSRELGVRIPPKNKQYFEVVNSRYLEKSQETNRANPDVGELRASGVWHPTVRTTVAVGTLSKPKHSYWGAAGVHVLFRLPPSDEAPAKNWAGRSTGRFFYKRYQSVSKYTNTFYVNLVLIYHYILLCSGKHFRWFSHLPRTSGSGRNPAPCWLRRPA